MKNFFVLDLKVTRREAGLTQADCAHLLGIDKSTFAKLERGERTISIRQACLLAIVYGQPLDSLLSAHLEESTTQLRKRLATLPKASSRWIGTFNRQSTLSDLAERLSALPPDDHGQR